VKKVILFEKSPSLEYLEEWTELLKKGKKDDIDVEISFIIFRLAYEWLALPVTALNEICEPRKIHKLPGCKKEVLKGIVNIHGQLRACVSMHKFLNIEVRESGDLSQKYQYMIVAQHEEDVWVFSVDEISGIYHFSKNQLTQAPITIARSAINYIKGIIEWNEKNVGVIDDELLFQSLKRNIL
jgi:chemotaxis-related protein WspD